MAIIFKYTFPIVSDTLNIPWPDGSKVVFVATQYSHDMYPTIWVEHPKDPQPDDPFRTFRFEPTGVPFIHGGEHVGSVVCAGGNLVWHVYQLKD